jgi:ABC-type nitrate/sulfonate/bicarbonate transport system substrate-binding protein
MASFRAALGLLLVLLLAAAPAPAQERPRKVRAAYSAISGAMLPAWVAAERGLFAKHGLDVDLSYIAAGPKLLGALLSGELQFGVLGHQGVDAAAAGGEVVYVASGLDRLVFYLFARPAIQRVEDLRGKRIAATRANAVSDIAARTALRMHGLEPMRDATILYVGGIPEVLAAIIAGRVDAGTISPPTSLQARKAGLRQVADVSGTPSIQSAVVTTRAYATQAAATTAGFVKAWTEAISVIHRDKPFALKVISQYTRADDPEIMEETYRTMAPHFKRAPAPPVEVIQTHLRELQQRDERARGLRAEDLVDARFVRELEESGFIAGLYR